MAKQWTYNGDVNLEHGGYYWRQDDPEDDYAYCVSVCGSDGFGGPDNIYLVTDGTVYIPDDAKARQDCLDVCGYKLIDNAIHDCCGGVFPLDTEDGRALLIDAIKASNGVEADSDNVIQIGKLDADADDYIFEPTDIIHGNNDLRNYIERTFL